MVLLVCSWDRLPIVFNMKAGWKDNDETLEAAPSPCSLTELLIGVLLNMTPRCDSQQRFYKRPGWYLSDKIMREKSGWKSSELYWISTFIRGTDKQPDMEEHVFKNIYKMFFFFSSGEIFVVYLVKSETQSSVNNGRFIIYEYCFTLHQLTVSILICRNRDTTLYSRWIQHKLWRPALRTKLQFNNSIYKSLNGWRHYISFRLFSAFLQPMLGNGFIDLIWTLILLRIKCQIKLQSECKK